MLVGGSCAPSGCRWFSLLFDMGARALLSVPSSVCFLFGGGASSLSGFWWWCLGFWWCCLAPSLDRGGSPCFLPECAPSLSGSCWFARLFASSPFTGPLGLWWRCLCSFSGPGVEEAFQCTIQKKHYLVVAKARAPDRQASFGRPAGRVPRVRARPRPTPPPARAAPAAAPAAPRRRVGAPRARATRLVLPLPI